MATWSEVASDVPEFAARVQALFDARKHKTMATLRRDGSPRISGIELEFEDGELVIGSMWKAVKALDLQRDPRFAIHSASEDPDVWKGDAKVAGTMEEVDPPEGSESHRFRADITELVVVRHGVPKDHIVVESWHAGEGVRRRKRY